MKLTNVYIGEAKYKDILPNLHLWIPSPDSNYSLYIIALQECLFVDELVKGILIYLGGNTEYAYIRRAIGSKMTNIGYHGYIALLIFVRREDIMDGTFVLKSQCQDSLATGKDIGVKKLQNKGGVTIAFSYKKASFAVVNVHLTSDSKGKSYLKKRNKDLRHIMKESKFASDDYGLEIYNCFDHVILLGDLNYRLRFPIPTSSNDLESLSSNLPSITETFKSGSTNPSISTLETISQDPRDIIDIIAALCKKESDTLKGKIKHKFEESKEESNYSSVNDEIGEKKDEEDSSWILQRYRDLILLPPVGEELEQCFLNNQKHFKEGKKACVDDKGNVTNQNCLMECSSPKEFSVDTNSSSNLVSWTWRSFLMHYDELTNEMQNNNVLCEFNEGLIEFPPSYRRCRGKLCGDYSDPNVLKEAYSLFVQEKRSNHGNSHKLESNKSNITFIKEIGSKNEYTNVIEQNFDVETKEDRDHDFKIPHVDSFESRNTSENTISDTEGRNITTRIPSYTDRILLHSLLDKQQNIVISSYELCDSLTCSDHRPVSSCLTIKYNTLKWKNQMFLENNQTRLMQSQAMAQVIQKERTLLKIIGSYLRLSLEYILGVNFNDDFRYNEITKISAGLDSSLAASTVFENSLYLKDDNCIVQLQSYFRRLYLRNFVIVLDGDSLQVENRDGLPATIQQIQSLDIPPHTITTNNVNNGAFSTHSISSDLSSNLDIRHNKDQVNLEMQTIIKGESKLWYPDNPRLKRFESQVKNVYSNAGLSNVFNKSINPIVNNRFICSLTDSFIFRITITNVKYSDDTEYMGLSMRQKLNETFLKGYYPLYPEDIYAATRRPGTTVEFYDDFIFHSSLPLRQPFRYFNSQLLRNCSGDSTDSKENLSWMAIVRPEFSSHLGFVLGSSCLKEKRQCVISLLPSLSSIDVESGSRMKIKNHIVVNKQPMIAGGTIRGYLSCDIFIKQYLLLPRQI